MRNENRLMRGSRGVALLIALLVTTLLIALIFEFAYGTRVSLRAAVNFRDSQRAYYLARSGVTVAGKLLVEYLKNDPVTGAERKYDNLEQREWQPVPLVGSGDSELLVRWEDEGGKINIGPQYYSNNQEWFRQLLTETEVSQEVDGKIQDAIAGGNKIDILSELHQYMNDEQFSMVKDFLTADSDGAINVNTASVTVLRSVLKGKTTSPDVILMRRKDKPITDLTETDINTAKYTKTSDYFKVFTQATVGGYTKQAEAVIKRDANGYTVRYWRIL